MKNLLTLVSVLLVTVSFGQTAEEYFNQAKAKYELQDYRGAKSDLTKAIELDPAYAKAYNGRGNVKYELKDYKGAC